MSNAMAQRPKFSAALQTEGYQRLINNTLQDPKRAQRFIASVSSAVSANAQLQECDAGTILSCALLGESLELSPSPQLGQYYMVPFEDKKKGCKVATFILGYKGYIQLAIRSGQYKKLNVVAVKQGELVRYDPLDEEIEVNLIQDELRREVAPTIGYYAMFEYVNGFKKAIYWSHEKMVEHATRYSAAFGAAQAKGKFPGRVSYDEYLAGNYNKDDEWAYSSFWYKDFDGMAFKTMLRQLISKWGIMSIEMRQAIESDDSVVAEDGTHQYIGGEDVIEMTETPQVATEEPEPEPDGDISMDDL